MYFELGIGMMIKSKKGEPILRFVVNDFSDYKMEHSLSELKAVAAKTLQDDNFYFTKEIVKAVSDEVGLTIDYRDVSYWAWLNPSLQFF